MRSFGLPVMKASIEMSKYGSFTFTYFGMRSDLAFVFGLVFRRSLEI